MIRGFLDIPEICFILPLTLAVEKIAGPFGKLIAFVACRTRHKPDARYLMLDGNRYQQKREPISYAYRHVA